MSQPTPSDRLLALFVPWMAERGFTYRKKDHRFRRPFAHGHQDFMLEFDGRGGFVTVTARFQVEFTELAERQARLGLPEWQLFRGLNHTAAGSRYYYDLYLGEYMNMTPRQRKGITSETTHPQERIEEGVRFLQDAYMAHVQPVFDAVQTERQLADAYLQCLRGKKDFMCPHPGFVIVFALLLAERLGDDMGELLTIARAMTHRSDMNPERIRKVTTELGIDLATA